MSMTDEFKGRCFGVRIQPRSIKGPDTHAMIQILCEDDEVWHESGQPFSSYWLRELIEQLEAAEKRLKSRKFKNAFENYGRDYKVRP